MRTITGIFKSRTEAESAVEELRALGIEESNVSLLAPGTPPEELEAQVPTTETEQPGMGSALGGAVGGALGVAGGLHLGAAAASLFVPGVGPIIAAGLLGATLLGAGGAATGMAAGNALEGSDALSQGLPRDELFVYEDALRNGRSVVIAAADSDEQAERARAALEAAGAESLDAARENWWVGLRDAEESEYVAEGRDFRTDEPVYRRGFEASLHPSARGRVYDEYADALRQSHSDIYGEHAFRRGYERGQRYHQTWAEKYRS